MNGNGFYNPEKEGYLASQHSPIPDSPDYDHDDPDKEYTDSIEASNADISSFNLRYEIDIDCLCTPGKYVTVNIPITITEDEDAICEGPNVVGMEYFRIIHYKPVPCPKCGKSLDQKEIQDLLTYYWED